MRLLFTFLLFVAVTVSSQAQERVRNIRVRVADSSKIEILYDMINARPGDSLYFDVRSRLRGALRISPEFVRGDVGTRLTPGTDRRIVWDALANGYSLNEEIQARVFVKTGTVSPASPPPAEPAIVRKPAVTTPAVPEKPQPSEPVAVIPQKPVQKPVTVPPTAAPQQKKSNRAKPSVFSVDSVQSQPPPAVASTPVPQQPAPSAKPMVPPKEARPAVVPADTVTLRRTRYAGPAWALVSVVAPGIGNIFVQTPKPRIGLRPILTVGCYGLLIYGFMERQKAQDTYKVYEQQKNIAAGEPYYQTANSHQHRYFLATRGALVVAAADVVLTFIRGIRNNQLQKEAQRYKGLTIRPGLQVGQPTAVVRYSF